MITPTKHFLLFTTGHGFLRVCEGSKIMRMVWFVILTGSIIACICQSSLLIEKFVSYKVNINIDLKGDPEIFVYPDVTVCPTTQLSLSVDYPHFSNKLLNISFENASENALLAWQKITKDYSKPLKDFNPIVRATMKPYVDFSNLSHHQYTFMAKCFLGPYECSKESMKQFLYFDYVCFTIDVRAKNTSSDFYDLLEIRLVDGYFEEVITQIYNFLSNNEQSQFVPGTLISIDPKGTIPNLMRNKIIITKNNEATTLISLSRYEYERNKVSCVKYEETSKLEIVQNEMIVNYNYSTDACINLETQNLIYFMCNCISRRYLVPSNLLSPSKDNINYCQYLPKEIILDIEQIGNFNTNIYKNRYFCEENVVNKVNNDEKYFSKRCPILCERIQYETNIKESKWPDLDGNKDEEMQYFKMYIIELLNDSIRNGLPTDYLEFKLDHLDDYSYIESSFSRLRLRLLDLRPSIFKETLSYQSINLWSEIGGLLGLYMGFSAISLCEVIEWLIKVIGSAFITKNPNIIPLT